jgi:hypothetical protein
LRAARANRVFCTDNNKDGVVFLYEIVDCARMAVIRAQSTIRADSFSSAQHRNSATTGTAICAAAYNKGGFLH